MMRNDEALIGAQFSLNYDNDGDDELDVISAIQWRGVALNKAATAFFRPRDLPSPSTATFVGSFQGTDNIAGPPDLPPASGAFAGGYQMGTVVWRVNAGVNTDGADVLSGILNSGMDFFAIAGAFFIEDRVLFQSASVNAVPEPGTAGLLALGLLGLVLASRRRPV